MFVNPQKKKEKQFCLVQRLTLLNFSLTSASWRTQSLLWRPKKDWIDWIFPFAMVTRRRTQCLWQLLWGERLLETDRLGKRSYWGIRSKVFSVRKAVSEEFCRRHSTNHAYNVTGKGDKKLTVDDIAQYKVAYIWWNAYELPDISGFL